MKPFSGGYIYFNIMLHQGSTRSTKIYNNAIFEQFTKEKVVSVVSAKTHFSFHTSFIENALH